jgi:hypothetical protein
MTCTLMYSMYNTQIFIIKYSSNCRTTIGKAPTHQVFESESLVRLRSLHSVQDSTLQGTLPPSPHLADPFYTCHTQMYMYIIEILK